jgi:hypothetical protein
MQSFSSKIDHIARKTSSFFVELFSEKCANHGLYPGETMLYLNVDAHGTHINPTKEEFHG